MSAELRKVSFGLKPHSGWAALVVLGADAEQLRVVDRRRIELVRERDAGWAKQPYHAAEEKPPAEARRIVERGIESARRIAIQEIEAAVDRARNDGHQVAACAVLMGEPMPDWTVDEILAVHFRMHKAEGVLFRDALARAADACRLKLVAIPEKRLSERAQEAFATPASALIDRIHALGKTVGAPWGKDQKEAALAALVALAQAEAQGQGSKGKGQR